MLSKNKPRLLSLGLGFVCRDFVVQTVRVFLCRDPAVDGSFFKAPVGSDLETGKLARRGVLVDGQRLHAEVARQFLDRKDPVIMTV